MVVSPDPDRSSEQPLTYLNRPSQSGPTTTPGVRGDGEKGRNGVAVEYVPPQVASLRKMHAQHLLDVVHNAERREAERQNKLRHSYSKCHRQYLQKRFKAERRKDEAQISGLLQDAQVAEEALRSSLMTEESVTSTSVGPKTGPDSSCPEESSSSHVGERSTRSNAIVEMNTVDKDSAFISTNKMRFMAKVFKKIDERKALEARSRADAAQAWSSERPKLRTQARPQQSGQGVPPGGHGESTRRRRLLGEKRGILLELQGLMSRQARALQCLAQDHALELATFHAGNNGDHTERLQEPKASSQLGSQHKNREPHGCRMAEESFASSIMTDCQARTTLSSRTRLTTSSASASASPKRCAPLLQSSAASEHGSHPKVSQTSAFLASGGQWRNDRSRSNGKQTSDASSASYATYGGRELKNGGVHHAYNSRRPRGVPSLKLKT